MKLNILSDLHLGCGALEIPRNDADVVILAGDVARPKEAVSWALGFAKPVLYVPGNHEFYGGSIAGAADELKQLCAGTNIRVLDNDQVIIQGVRYLGTTLWTDFMLWTDGEQRSLAMQEAQRFMRDFSKIHVDEPVPRLFTPDDAAALVRSLHGRAELELMGDFAHPFAVRVQCAFLGWPASMHEPLRLWAQKNHAATFAQDRQAMAEIAHEFAGYVTELLQVRRAAGVPGSEDVTASLACQQVKGRPLNDEEIISALRNWTVGEIGPHLGGGRRCGPVSGGTNRTRHGQGRDRTGNHGGDLGCRRDAGRRCLRALADRHRRDESGESQP